MPMMNKGYNIKMVNDTIDLHFKSVITQSFGDVTSGLGRFLAESFAT
jgi:hypothetical protein